MESELLAAHQRTDIDVTLEGIQSDLDIMNDDNLRKLERRILSFYSKKTPTSKVGDELRLYLLDRMRYCIDWYFHH